VVARFDLKRFLADERGATAVEYGILIACLSLALVAVFKDAQQVLITTLTNATGKVAAATGQ
jgi:pilus assembly protein Flp/PilA